jgi:3-hydroxyisobutyrate dehydrogenase-like beta-hydroxyacid dehydrogenase
LESAGSVVVLHSTVHPDTCKFLAEAAARVDVRVLDIPVSGGVAGAEQGTLLAMAAGDHAALEECRAVLGAYCSEVVSIGPSGAGQVAKLANNVMSLVNTAAAFEALAVADAMAVDRDQMIQVAQLGSGASRVLQTWESRADLMSAAAEDERRSIAIKDLRLALELAEAAEVNMPLTEVVLRLLEELIDPDEPRTR